MVKKAKKSMAFVFHVQGSQQKQKNQGRRPSFSKKKKIIKSKNK
jgi:hypothetical protein